MTTMHDSRKLFLCRSVNNMRNVQRQPVGGSQMEADTDTFAEMFWEFTQQSSRDDHIPVVVCVCLEHSGQ